MNVFIKDNADTMRREAYVNGEMVAFVNAAHLCSKDMGAGAWFPFYLNKGPWKEGQMFGVEIRLQDAFLAERLARVDAVVDRAHFDREYKAHRFGDAIEREHAYAGWRLCVEYYDRLYHPDGTYSFLFTAPNRKQYRLVEFEPGKAKLQEHVIDLQFIDCEQDIDIIMYGMAMILNTLQGRPL